MTRIALLALLLAGCIDPEPEPELVWNVDVSSRQLVVGQSVSAYSEEALPSGASAMPLDASWYTVPPGIVELSNDVGSTIMVEALVPGDVTLVASAGGSQGGASREIALVVLAP